MTTNMGGLLGIEPTELKFPFELKKQSSCALNLSNKTNGYVAFKVKTTRPNNCSVRPNQGVVSPRSTCRIIVKMQAQTEAPQSMKCQDKFLVLSMKVETGMTAEDITSQMFSKEGGVVEECKLRAVYVAPSHVPEGSDEQSLMKDSASEDGNCQELSTAAEPQIQPFENHSLGHKGEVVLAPEPNQVLFWPSETAKDVYAQPVEPLSARVIWIIKKFSSLNTKKLYSDVFVVGGYKWRILIFPKGNNVDHISIYLDFADSQALPSGWSKYAQFSLKVISQVNLEFTIRKETQHRFNARENDWGFTCFMPLTELYNIERGFLVNDTLFIQVDVEVSQVINCLSNDIKKASGYVGLTNQGATIYLNSLLQSLYHIPYLRKAVYHMPNTESDAPTESIPLALQRLFYKLQYSNNNVSTTELIKSFGWDTFDFFVQHHVLELNRILFESLEAATKGTVVEETIQLLFKGHFTSYSECISVDFKFTNLMLDVRGCRDVYASFNKYVEADYLTNGNKNNPEQHGLQDAKKGVGFIDFPPVLQLQLKRFEYDLMQDTMVKINDRYEYPLQLDLDRENGKYLSPEADRTVRNLYTLYSVLVHSADVNGGHYYSYIRPTLSDQWFKFDDERVTKVDTATVLEGQYGEDEELPQANSKATKCSNAHLLVYIRESDQEKVMCTVDEKDIAHHLRIRLEKEQDEEKVKEKEKTEAHFYNIIKVPRNDKLHEQKGKDLIFDHKKNRAGEGTWQQFRQADKISDCRRICLAREGSHVEWIFLQNDTPVEEADVARADNGSGSVVVDGCGQLIAHKIQKLFLPALVLLEKL